MSDWDDGRPAPSDQPPSVGRLVEQVSEQATRLVRAEIALAKAEIAQKAKQSVIGIVLLVGALIIVAYAVGVLIWSAVFGLAVAWPLWLSALVVGVAMIVLAGVLVWVGIKLLGRAASKPETIDRVKDDVQTLKEGLNQ